MTTPLKLPSHDWHITITLREDLNLSHPANDGEDLLSEAAILAGLADFLRFPEGLGLEVKGLEIRGPLLEKGGSGKGRTNAAEEDR